MPSNIDIPNARPLYIPVPTQQDPERGRIILKDGSSANLRVAQAEDFQAMRDFNHRLSIESLQFRFFSNQEPDDTVVRQLCESLDPTDHMTLLVEREVEHEPVIVGYGVYAKCTPKIAEFSVAVYDEYQGLGIGAVLLDRLAMVALNQGFETFRAIASAANHRMLTVFRHSGFSVDTVVSDGYAEIDLNIIPTPSSIERSDSRDRHFAKASLEKFFNPKGVLLVGDIDRSASVASRVYQNIKDSYAGFVEAFSLSSPSLTADIQGGARGIELAVVVSTPAAVEGLVDTLAHRGVQALCIISADGSDPNADAKTHGVELSATLRQQGIRLIGSQSFGFFTTRPDHALNASLSSRLPKSGTTAIASQSGSIGLALIDLARERSLGLADFVSMGAKLDISGNDLLQYWADDEAVNCILLYLESFGNPRRFVHLARKVSRQKPILVMKSGYREHGPSDGVRLLASREITAQQSMDALFEQSGVVRVNTLEEMFYAAAGFSRQPAPRGNRVAIISNAYGPALLCGDACRVSGLKMPPPLHPLCKALESIHTDIRFTEEGFHIPIDLAPEATQQVISLLLEDCAYDAVIFLHSGLGAVDHEGLRAAIREGVRSGRKSNRGLF